MVEGGHDIIQIFKRTRWRLYSIIRPATIYYYSTIFKCVFIFIYFDFYFLFFWGAAHGIDVSNISSGETIFKIEQNPDVNNLNMYTKEMILKKKRRICFYLSSQFLMNKDNASSYRLKIWSTPRK